LLIAAGILIWLLFYRRRYYDVIIQEGSFIIGGEKARRKKAYTFHLEEGHAGAVSYRVGEDGGWRQVFPDVNERYTIKGNEVIGDIFLETHP
jgi:hypothetical protein